MSGSYVVFEEMTVEDGTTRKMDNRRKLPDPDPIIDYVSEWLAGMPPGASYHINDVTVGADADVRVDINSPWFGKRATIMRRGGNVATRDDGQL